MQGGPYVTRGAGRSGGKGPGPGVRGAETGTTATGKTAKNPGAGAGMYPPGGKKSRFPIGGQQRHMGWGPKCHIHLICYLALASVKADFG